MRLGMGLGLGNLLSGQPLTGFPNDFSFNFDGSNDYLELNGTLESVFQGAFTISAWIKPDDGNPSGINALFGSDSTSDQDRFRVMLKTDGKIGILYKSNGAGSEMDDDSTSAVFSNGATDWTHIAVTITESSGTVTGTVYINGSSIAGSFSGSADMSAFETATNFAIGGANRAGSLTQHFNGLIDEVAIWNTALDASTIAKLGSKPLDLTKYSASNLKLWLRAGDKVLPESDTSIARSDFYTDFDGTNDYVSVADNDDLSFGSGSADSPLSISAWINPVDATNFTIVSKGVFSTDAEYIFQLDGDDKLFFGLYDESVDNTYEGAYFNTALTSYQGSWFHVCVTYNGVGGTSANAGVKLYIDGVEKSTSLIGGGTYVAMENLGGELEIGRISSTYADGKISNLALYKTQLDAQTIKQFAKSRYTPMRDNRFSVVDFDGSDDRVDCGQIDVSGQNITLSAWVYRDGTGDDVIAGRWSTNGAMLYCSGEYVRWYINSGLATTTIPDKTWVHIVGTFDGVNRKIYKDGVLEDTDADTSTIVNPSQNFEIGNAEYHGSVGFIGSISSVSLYNTAKSAEEIYAIYQQGITYDESSLSGLVGYWRMGDDTSKAYPTIADSSSNSNDGTIENGASDDIVQQMVAGYDMGAFESSEELGGSEITSASNKTFSGVTSNDWTSSGATKSFSNDQMVFTMDGDSPAVVAQFSAGNFVGGSGIPQKFLKVTLDIDSTTTGSYRINNAGGSCSVNVFLKNPLTTGINTVYGLCDGANSYFRIFEADVSTGDKLVLNSFDVQEVLQSDLSDTYPAIIDVNEPVLGAELFDADASTFDSGTHSWVVYGSNTIANDNGALKITYVNNAFGAYLWLKDASDLSTDLTIGKTYKFTFDAKVSSGASVDVTISTLAGSPQVITETSFTTKSIYFTAENTNSTYVDTRNMGSGEIIYLDNLSLKEIQGNVGTMTNQDSADLVYSSVLPDQSFLTGVNSAYNFIDLDGSNESISVSDSSSLQITGDMTISLWVNPEGTTANRIFVQKRDSGGTNYQFYMDDSSNPLLRFFDGSTATSSSSAITKSQWNHVAISIDSGVSNGSVFYINGQASGTATFTISADDAPLNIGKHEIESTYIDGKIGQVAVHNKALSATEVGAIYTLGRHGNLLDSYSDNLLGYWAMSALDASTGLSDSISTIYDRSGNSNHGTPQNADAGDLASSPNAEPNGYAKGDTNRSTTTP